MALIPQNFLFHMRFPTLRAPQKTARLAAEALDERYSIPFWSQYAAPDGIDKRLSEPGVLRLRNPEIANRFDFRVAWAPDGLTFTFVLRGKKSQPSWTRAALKYADCVRICLDARDLKDARRAGKFCHKFLFYPFVGESRDSETSLAQWVPINRAKASPNAVDVADFKMNAERRVDGYAFSIFIPGSSITGYDVEEFNRVGLHYAARDSQYGAFVLQYADPTPVEDDPSLWASFIFRD